MGKERDINMLGEKEMKERPTERERKVERKREREKARERGEEEGEEERIDIMEKYFVQVFWKKKKKFYNCLLVPVSGNV